MVAMSAERGLRPGGIPYLRELGLPTLFGAVVLLCSATMLLLANVTALRSNLGTITRTEAVLDRLSVLEKQLISSEMTVRGYALTGDPRFVEFLKSEQSDAEAARRDLLRLGEANSSQAVTFKKTMRAVEQHMVVFGALGHPGPGQAQAVAKAIVDPKVRLLMRQTREGLTALRAGELYELEVRQRQMTDQITRSFLLAIGIIAFAFLFGGVGIWVYHLSVPPSGLGTGPKARRGSL